MLQIKTGVFSSRAFNIWMCGVIAFLAIALNVPVLRKYLDLTAIGIMPVLRLAGIAVSDNVDGSSKVLNRNSVGFLE